MNDGPNTMCGHLCGQVQHPVESSVPRRCLECREPIWITPASLDLAAEHECIFLCVPCLVDASPPGDVEVEPPNEAQRREFAR